MASFPEKRSKVQVLVCSTDIDHDGADAIIPKNNLCFPNFQGRYLKRFFMIPSDGAFSIKDGGKGMKVLVG